MKLRMAKPEDLEAFYHICLVTADYGRDATAHYRDPQMIGHIYAAPYLVLEPEFCFVPEDEDGVCGYIVGTPDTRDFEARLEQRWWPVLRQRYACPSVDQCDRWTPDDIRAHTFHHPGQTPDEIVSRCPAHIHMNLLPRARGRGMARRMLNTWLEKAAGQGVTHVHLGASKQNENAVSFWQHTGFKPLPVAANHDENTTIWLGRQV